MNEQRLTQLREMIRRVNPSQMTEGLKETLESRTAVVTEGPHLDTRRIEPRRNETEFVLESLDLLVRGEDSQIDSERQFVLESIVMPYHRPVVDIVDDRMQVNQLTQHWSKLSTVELRPRIEQCLLSIGRIDVPYVLYAGTGFVVGDGLLMTNRHVAAIFASGIGTREVQFQPGQSAAFDFYHELGRAKSESLVVEEVVMIHPYWDLALLRVRNLRPIRRPLALSTVDPSIMEDRTVVVIGYPGYDPTGDDDFQKIQNHVFRGTYYVKRLQPGCIRGRDRVESYQHTVDAINHDCSTLGGNSGSAVIAIPESLEEPIEVIGVHFAGKYLVANYAVPTFDLARDVRVVDTGINFAGDVRSSDLYEPIWRKVDAS